MTDYSLSSTPKRRGKRYKYTGTRYPAHRGEWFTVREWCDLTGQAYSTVRRIAAAFEVITDESPPHDPSVDRRIHGGGTPGPKPQRYEYVGTKYRRHRGKYFSCREWANITGERPTTVRYRVQADGGVIKDTDWKYQRRTRPVDYIYTGVAYPDLTGQRFTVREFADATGLSERAVRHRIEKVGGECIPDMRVYTRRSET